MKTLFLLALWLLLTNCQKQSQSRFSPEDLKQTSWEKIEVKARGTTVNLAMYAGDEARNRFFQTEVVPQLKEKHGIALKIVPLGDTAEAVNKLLNEKQAGKIVGGSIDAIWINGENFRTAKQADLLWGAFAEKLPNFSLYEASAGKKDFGTPINGLEAPWLRGQFTLAYDAARINAPPRNIEALRRWIKENPGKFAYIAPPDFTGSAFLRHILFYFGGGAADFENGFDEKLYADASSKTFEFLNEIEPFLWRNGETFPNSPKELNQLFANGEVEFAFSYAPNFASDAIKRGEFPATVRTFVFEAGTIRNYNFLAVPFNAANPPGAFVTINYLMSHEFLLAHSRVLGAAYPHDLSKLTAEQRAAVAALPRGVATLSDEEQVSHAVNEADAAYLERLEKDWREQVLLK